jgi:hypothetical protein
MTSTGERDSMVCRSCEKEERASEGYPCTVCGTFLCVHCNMRGVIRCRDCEAKQRGAPQAPAAPKARQ